VPATNKSHRTNIDGRSGILPNAHVAAFLASEPEKSWTNCRSLGRRNSGVDHGTPEHAAKRPLLFHFPMVMKTDVKSKLVNVY